MTTSVSIKSRFCPSPTGLMHLGNLRTALFNVLLAKSYLAQKQAASFLLRIEDTDLARSEQEFTQSLMKDLLWLDLDWQEGPNHHKGHEPYYQAQRTGIYQKYYQQLLQNKQAYWCFCTDTELTITRKTQLQAGMPPRYAGTCRHLTQEQIEAKRAKGLVPALRFRIPDNESIHFDDFIQGPKTFATDDIGDFIIEKADGSASFMFCNAVDDALMEVTHVMRGEDHLTNTPRQLLILKALGLKAPLYGHMPLILGFDGKPLSKRNGSQSIESLREQGYFPLAINNYLSRLGHHFENEKLLSLDELGEHFDISHIGRSPARFDLAQLNHWQKETVLTKSDDEFWNWVKPYVEQYVPKEKISLFVQTVKKNIVLPQDAIDWAIQLLGTNIDSNQFFNEEALDVIRDQNKENEISVKQVLDELEKAIQQKGDNYNEVINELVFHVKKKGKVIFKPLRSAITGRCDGPELANIFSLMGKELLLKRVGIAKEISETSSTVKPSMKN
ncbi:MAG: glutamate--tRNA ligase [Gammaproteobacteria bacterium]|jgi:glutamyl-tRNA synthetase|nr:glutamate--tRNA ligase [Gammaproteobacteria bacterium]